MNLPFLKRGYKLQSIRTIRVDLIESIRIDNIFNPPSKSRSTTFSKSHANRLPACRINRRGNNLRRFDGIGFTNWFPVCRIANTKDESALVGCIGQPSKCKDWKQVILLSITKVTYRAVPGVQLIVNETIFLFGSSDMLVQSHQTFLYSWWLGFF